MNIKLTTKDVNYVESLISHDADYYATAVENAKEYFDSCEVDTSAYREAKQNLDYYSVLLKETNTVLLKFKNQKLLQKGGK